MSPKRLFRGQSPEGRLVFDVPYRGADLIGHPLFNKSSAFTAEERGTFGLEGLLPASVSTMQLQASRVYANIVRKSDPLERYIGLAALQDRNEHLYYRVLLDNIEEFLPIVYTPTVGQASKEYSHIFRRGRGIWVTPSHRGRIKDVLETAATEDVRLIVATDNQAILGIGDQGAGGMVIPIGKLAIYSAAAGIHPALTLPVSLDVGTNNEDLLGDELYLGWRKPRLEGDDYFSLIDEFVAAVRDLFPKTLLQWEDFRNENAFSLLERYRGLLLSFNDDIQGTGATALGGILAGARLAGGTLLDQRVTIVGAGAAGGGIAGQIRAALKEAGLDQSEIHGRIAVLDRHGLLVEGREGVTGCKKNHAWPRETARAVGLDGGSSLAEVVDKQKPTVLIGSSGQAGLFSEDIVRAMASYVERPMVFPFSNPTSLAEATPENLIRWTDGRALIATGSPFEPMTHNGHEHRFGQGNNAFVFPGIGLGALVAEATEVTDGMFSAAGIALAGSVSEDELAVSQLYPDIGRLRNVTRTIAVAVAKQALRESVGRDLAEEDVDAAVGRFMWTPEYPVLVPT